MKKTQSIKLALIVICFTTALISCDKNNDDDSTPTPPIPPPATEKTKAEILAKSAWIVKASGIDLDKNGTIDYVVPGVKACTLDNTYSFNTNGSGLLDEAALKCDALAPQTSPFSWTFKNNETVINGDMPVAGWTGDGVITALNDTSFVFYKDTLVMGVSARAIVSLKH